MEKRNYVKPVLNSEAFLPNEYIAACWGIGCNVDVSNAYEQNNYAYDGKTWEDLGVSHDITHCGHSANQVIYDDDDDGIADRMIEEKTDGLGDLRCTIYTSSSYTEIKPIRTIKPGDNIYWTTASGDRIWHHVGLVQATFPGRPNHS